MARYAASATARTAATIAARAAAGSTATAIAASSTATAIAASTSAIVAASTAANVSARTATTAAARTASIAATLTTARYAANFTARTAATIAGTTTATAIAGTTTAAAGAVALPRSPSPKRSSSPTQLPALSSNARKAKERQLNYNLLGDVLLSDTSLDTVPEQIRAALHKKRLRVTDLFHQLDDDQSGTISCKEFEKALKEFGLRGPQGGPVDKESVQAVFNSFDPDR